MRPARRIKQAAAELRFDACGIAAVDAPIDPDNHLGAWLNAGFHADMDWLARTRSLRQELRERMPEARSVVVLARNYHAVRPPQAEGAGRVSNYAWGRDYHRVLHKPVRRLAAIIAAMGPDIATWCSIDAGPVMEKAWAARAGVGWVGKNSLVLRRGMGSYFFLAAIVTTLALEADERIVDGCATCRACIDACPTGAITAPQVVDARRCISYQTIENRGEVPTEIAPKQGDWIFGCDICQEVCPYNRRVTETSELGFHPRPGHAFLDLEAVDAMDDAAFEQEFRGTPIMRAKRKGMQRNAVIVRKNHGSQLSR